jgi:hypothetical protein
MKRRILGSATGCLFGFIHSRSLATFLVLTSCLACSCSRKSTPPPVENRGPNPFISAPDLTTLPGTVCDVKFSPATIRIEPENFIHALRGISPDHTIYIFDKSSDVARSLQPGKVMFVPGLTLQKVIATAEDGQDLIVGADDHTPLAEAFENATIKWDYPVNFQQAAAQQKKAAIVPMGRPGLLGSLDGIESLLTSSVWAAPPDSGEESGEEEGWKFNVHAQPDASGLAFQAQLEKKLTDAGVNATIEAKGNVQNFRNVTSIIINKGNVDSFGFHNQSMNATVNLVWTVSKSEPGTATGEEDFRLPTSFSLPLIISGIPFSLEISEAVMFKPGFTSKGELAKGGFKLQMTGDNGFKWNGGDVEQDGSSSGENSIDDESGISPVAPFAILIAVAVPRIELSTGPEAAFENLKGLVPPTLGARLARVTNLLGLNHAFGQWLADRAREALKPKGAAYAQIILSTSATIGSATALIPCQMRKLVVSGTAGVSLRLPNLPKDWKSERTFYRDEKSLTRPPIKGCSL